MKRKIIGIGKDTEVVTLPKDWTRKYNLKKGDSVELSIEHNTIQFSTRNDGKRKEISQDLRGSNKAAVQDFITAAYRYGYDKVSIEFDPEVVNIWKDDVLVSTREAVQKEVHELIGFQVTLLEDTKAEIHDIAGVSKDHFDTMLRRTFLLMHRFAQDIHKGLTEKDEKLLEFVADQYISMRQYIRYCMRYLTKVGRGDQTAQYVKLVSKLDLARVSLRFLIKLHEETAIKQYYSKDALSILEETTALFYDVYQNYYEFSMDKVTTLFKRRQMLVDRAYKLSESRNRADAVASTRLIYAFNSISSIINVSIALNFEMMEAKK